MVYSSQLYIKKKFYNHNCSTKLQQKNMFTFSAFSFHTLYIKPFSKAIISNHKSQPQAEIHPSLLNTFIISFQQQSIYGIINTTIEIFDTPQLNYPR